MITEIFQQVEPLFAFRFIGLVGFLLYMTSFAALQFGWLSGGDLGYSFLNVLAASLVLISLMGEFNLPSAMIQICWIVIGGIGIALRLWRALPNI